MLVAGDQEQEGGGHHKKANIRIAYELTPGARGIQGGPSQASRP